MRAEMAVNAGRKQSEIDQDYKQAAELAALAAPYRHPRLSAMRLPAVRAILCTSKTMLRRENCEQRSSVGSTYCKKPASLN